MLFKLGENGDQGVTSTSFGTDLPMNRPVCIIWKYNSFTLPVKIVEAHGHAKNIFCGTPKSTLRKHLLNRPLCIVLWFVTQTNELNVRLMHQPTCLEKIFAENGP